MRTLKYSTFQPGQKETSILLERNVKYLQYKENRSFLSRELKALSGILLPCVFLSSVQQQAYHRSALRTDQRLMNQFIVRACTIVSFTLWKFSS